MDVAMARIAFSASSHTNRLSCDAFSSSWSSSLSKASAEAEEMRLPKALKTSVQAMTEVFSTALRGFFIVFTIASTTFSLPQIDLPTTHESSDRFGYYDIEPEDEVRPDFQCPYCYEDHDITSLCAHLEDEHPFESKVVACPVCSARVSKDLLDHLTLQHGYLFKLQRHHRLRRVPAPSNHPLSIAERDQQETYLKALLGNSNRSSGTNTSSSISDSLLSSLVLNLSLSEAEDTAKSSAVVENWFRRSVASKTWKTSPESNLSHEERDRRWRRAAVKASFVQHLLVSTLFDE